MGFFDFLAKSAEVLIPVALELFGDNEETSPSTIHLSIDEMIAECEELLSLVSKLTVDDDEDIVNTLTAFDRRYLKLEKIDETTDDFALSKKLNELDIKRDKTLTAIENMYYDYLNVLSEKSAAEKDPETWSELNDKWFEYNKKSNRITDYQLEYLSRLANQASDFING